MSSSGGPQFDATKHCYPSKYDRRLLVWYKKFPNMESIPDQVSTATVRKVKQKARIHTNLLIMGFFSVAFLVQALRGRAAWKEGQSVTGMNMDWHKRYNETGVIGDIHRGEEGELVGQKR